MVLVYLVFFMAMPRSLVVLADYEQTSVGVFFLYENVEGVKSRRGTAEVRMHTYPVLGR